MLSESKLDIAGLIEKAIEDTEVITITAE